MGSTPESQEKSRQACEACRRKKTKCPAERPVCSFCQRLSVDCVYLPREHSKTSSNVRKNTKLDTKDRVRVLESQINDLYRAFNAFTDRPSQSETTSATSNINQDTLPRPSNIHRIQPMHPVDSRFSLSNPEPSEQALEHMIETYRTTVHLQPLPLFYMASIRDDLRKAPKYLLWSFLALTVPLSRHGFYDGQEADAIEFYTGNAEQSVNKLAAQGMYGSEIIRSLCLLSLVYIRATKTAKAWMMIGTAARLENFRLITRDLQESTDSDISSRCYWSVFILERVFAPQWTSLSDAGNIPKYPPSAMLPPAPISGRDSSVHPDLIASEETIEDLGINAYFIQMVSIWSNVASYLHDVHSGKVEIPWTPDSSHAKLNMKLHELEAQLPQRHLLRNVFFSRRSRTEIQQQREYWLPWVVMQIATHSSWALVHHPFIHMGALREKRGISQSRHFLQQAVDQALFHSGWVFRLLRICNDLQFELMNPLIAHMVGAVAIIPWIFQFAQDSHVSTNANKDLETCTQFLGCVSVVWPSAREKLELLKVLQSTTHTDTQNAADKATTLRFQPSVFWDLLDPKIRGPTEAKQPATDGVDSGTGSADAFMRVATHYIHPLVDGHQDQQTVADFSTTIPSIEDFEQLPMDELFAHFVPDDLAW